MVLYHYISPVICPLLKSRAQVQHTVHMVPNKQIPIHRDERHTPSHSYVFPSVDSSFGFCVDVASGET